MDKIELEIIGISANTTGNNAYALILKEVEGNRQLPIVIGASCHKLFSALLQIHI